MSRWVAMFPGVSGARVASPEVATALAAAGIDPSVGDAHVETYGASVAGFHALGAEPAALAEHSMGIYAALTAAGVWTFEDGARVTAMAQRFIEEEAGDGALAACVGLPYGKVAELAAAAGAWVANDNSELQQVVGGRPGPLKAFEAAARAAGAYDVVRIPVRGAIHTRLLENAARRLFEFLGTVEMKAPRIPILNHVDVGWVDCPEVLRQHVAGALERPVKWREVVERLLREGYDTFVDVGPGEVLAKLVKWVKRDARIGSVSANLQAAMKLISA